MKLNTRFPDLPIHCSTVQPVDRFQQHLFPRYLEIRKGLKLKPNCKKRAPPVIA